MYAGLSATSLLQTYISLESPNHLSNRKMMQFMCLTHYSHIICVLFVSKPIRRKIVF